MKIKWAFTFLCIVCLSKNTFGQLYALSDQHIFNGLAINPAFAGNEEAFSAIVTYRNQWIGFEGAPQTMTTAIHSPLGEGKVGIGLLIVNDQIGVSKQTSIMGNYAYRIKMGAARLSFGAGLGLTVLNAYWDQLEVTDVNDEELLNGAFSNTSPNFSAGVYYQSRDFFLGLSLPMLLSYEYSNSNESWVLSNDISEYNIHLTGGYIVDIAQKLSFYPAGLLKYHAGNALQFDVYAQLIYNNFIWLGAGYRSLNTLIGLLQVKLNGQFRLAYSYDFDMGSVGKYSNGSHEVMLRYVFKVDSKVDGPSRF
jgi:type IX secretion system PorP/SprF family membrane protein